MKRGIQFFQKEKGITDGEREIIIVSQKVSVKRNTKKFIF